MSGVFFFGLATRRLEERRVKNREEGGELFALAIEEVGHGTKEKKRTEEKKATKEERRLSSVWKQLRTLTDSLRGFFFGGSVPLHFRGLSINSVKNDVILLLMKKLLTN